MAVLVRGKVLFLAHPRTASTAMRNSLEAIGGEVINPHHVAFDHPDVRRRYRGEPVLAVIRNPYDMLVSWWGVRTWVRERDTKLAGFIAGFDDTKGNFQRHGKLFYHLPAATIVLRYEDIDTTLKPALEDLGIEPFELPRLNETLGKKDWRSYYDDDAIRAANKRFGDEIAEHYTLLEPT